MKTDLDIALGFKYAVFSPCEKYRYTLGRFIDPEGLVAVAFFGINPSTADAKTDDPTIKKMTGFSKKLKARNFVVANVFAYRSTDVNGLVGVSDPYGPENSMHLDQVISEANILVPCWGAREKLPVSLRHCPGRLEEKLRASGKPIFCLGLTNGGDPKHPLMLGYDTPIVEWK